MKECTKCKVKKELSDFSKRKDSKDGFRNECRVCLKKYLKNYQKENRQLLISKKREYYQLNKEDIKKETRRYRVNNKEKISEQNRKYYKNNKESIAVIHNKYYTKNKEELVKKNKDWIENHKEERAKYLKKYRKNNKEKIVNKKKYYYEQNKEKIKKYKYDNKEKTNAHRRNRIATEPLYRLKNRLRSRTCEAFNNKGYKKKYKTQEVLGAGWEVCKEHIEIQFTEGMNWDNKVGWHIDHIIPLASSNTEEELITLCNYQNLQPLWAKDNLGKSAKYNEIDKVNMIKKIKDSLIQKVSQVIEK
jgi:hypothetical protein